MYDNIRKYPAAKFITMEIIEEEIRKALINITSDFDKLIHELVTFLKEKGINVIDIKCVWLLEEFFSIKFSSIRDQPKLYNRLLLHASSISNFIYELLRKRKHIKLTQFEHEIRDYIADQYRHIEDLLILLMSDFERIDSINPIIEECLAKKLKENKFSENDAKIIADALYYAYSNNSWVIVVTKDYNMKRKCQELKVPLILSTPTFAVLYCELISQLKEDYKSYFLRIRPKINNLKECLTGPATMYG